MDYCAIQILKAEIKLVWKVNISKLNSSNCRDENFLKITRKTKKHCFFDDLPRFLHSLLFKHLF